MATEVLQDREQKTCTSTVSITLKRPQTADCKGTKAEDACSRVRRIRRRTEAWGIVIRPWDVVRKEDPLARRKGIEDDIGTEPRVVSRKDGGSRLLVLRSTSPQGLRRRCGHLTALITVCHVAPDRRRIRC